MRPFNCFESCTYEYVTIFLWAEWSPYAHIYVLQIHGDGLRCFVLTTKYSIGDSTHLWIGVRVYDDRDRVRIYIEPV